MWAKTSPTPYQPDRAKALLAEAGFPNGLRVTINGPNDRYVNDAKIIQAVAQMWQRIGVQTTVEAMPWNTFVARAGKQEVRVGAAFRHDPRVRVIRCLVEIHPLGSDVPHDWLLTPCSRRGRRRKCRR